MYITSPSPLLSAVVKLQDAKLHVEKRADGSWWVLDELVWSRAADLAPAEYEFFLNYVNVLNARRADRFDVDLAEFPNWYAA